ncbi:MAG: GNAT family N-acetyltransferase [Mangrovibacterium sp.]
MDRYSIKQGNENDLDLIGPLWEKLNQLHFDLSPHFKSRFQDMTWNKRKQKLLEKSKDILFNYVIDNENNKIIGYCISTIDIEDHKIGEIDSIYVDETYRKSGLGKQLVERAIQWLKSRNTETQKLIVAAGNESVSDFYRQFDFYPLHIVLQRHDGVAKNQT